MENASFKRKLAAIFSADVVGYSRLMGEDEAETITTLSAFKNVMFTLIKQHRGRVVDSPGDNLLAEFASVVDAVQCAVAVQQELKARNEERPENRRMTFRIGINLGDVIEEDGSLFGDGVNIAARLESLADTGGICISNTAFDQIETKLPFGYEYLGEKEVKNIAKPVGAYRVLMGAEEAGKMIGGFRRRTRHLRWAAASGAAVVVLLAGVLAFWIMSFRHPSVPPASVERMSFPLPDAPSIAVLPFENLSGDSQDDYYSNGVAGQIINALSKTPQLFVISRYSTFFYKGKTVEMNQVAEDLGVRYILEGDLRRSEDRLEIGVRFEDAIEGYQLWGKTYDGHPGDIFLLQDRITKKVLNVLEVTPTDDVQARIYAKYTLNSKANEKYLQAVEQFRRLRPEGNLAARQLLKETLALDPGHKGVPSMLAWSHFNDAKFGWTQSRPKSFRQAFRFAKRAVTLNPLDAEGHALLGRIYLSKRQHESAITEGKKAVDLDPNAADNLAFLAVSTKFSGNPEEAVSLIQKAMRLNPHYPKWYLFQLAHSYQLAGEHNRAISAYQRLIDERKMIKQAHIGLAVTYVLLGREEEARLHGERILRQNPDFSLDSYMKRQFYKDPAVARSQLDALRSAGLT
jgi:adenylate cyclase